MHAERYNQYSIRLTAWQSTILISDSILLIAKEAGLQDIRHFNPHIVHVDHGELCPKEAPAERMVMWYEVELITGCGPNAGIIMLDQFISLEKGMVFFRQPGDIVRGVPPYSYISILFDIFYDEAMEADYQMGGRCASSSVNLSFLRRLAENRQRLNLQNRPPPVIRVADVEAVSLLFLELARLRVNHQKADYLLAKAQLLMILAKLHKEARQAEAVHAEQPDVIEDTQRFMNASYDQPIMLATLAKRACMSREHLCRLYKKHTGLSPIQYLTQLRVFYAKRMLLADNCSVESIAARCGFKNTNYFYKVFRDSTGLTPLQYRNGVSLETMSHPHA